MSPGFGSLRDAQKAGPDAKLMEQMLAEIKPAKEEEPKKKRKAPPKNASQLPKKPIKQKESFETEPVEEETISLSVHEDKVKKLEDKIEKLDKKNKELSEKNKEFKDNVASSDKANKNEKKRADGLEKKLETLNQKYDQLNKDYKLLKQTPSTDSEQSREKSKEIDDLKKKIKKLEKENGDLSEKKSDLEGRCKELDTRISELEKQLEDSKVTVPQTDIKKDEGDIIISRISATEFYSEAFTGMRYKVSLSKDCSYMVFKQDIMGKAVCENGIISLPKMTQYLSFKEKKDYVARNDNQGLIISLN